MVYHEERKVNGKIQNYLIHNERKNNKWVKKSKYIGSGQINKEKIQKLKKEFEIEIMANKKFPYLKKEDTIEIEKLKKRYLKKIKSLEKEELVQLKNSFFTELTYNSNAIEGNTLSLQETSLVLNEGLAPEGKTLREIHEAKNHQEAIEFVKSYEGDLNEKFILKLHSVILKNISKRFGGRYRESDVKIFGSNVKFPSSNEVPQLMKNLIHRYKKNKDRLHQFELATITSMEFLTIHPFVDGNGRVSRLIMNFLLDKGNYPWINIYNKNRQKYLEAVRKANDENYSLIFPLLIKTLKENLEDFGI